MILLRKPDEARLARELTRRPGLRPNYPEIGATRDPLLPKGYHHLDRSARIGEGAEAFSRVAALVRGWGLQRRSGLVLASESPTTLTGTQVAFAAAVGPRLPGGVGVWVVGSCEVIWDTDEARRAGFGYGTLPGHPECGEESFTVEHRDDDSVWVTIRAFSRPAIWSARLAGPLAAAEQRRATDRYLRAAQDPPA